MKRSSPHPLLGGPGLVLLVSALTGCDQGELATSAPPPPPAEPVKAPALPIVAGFFGFPDAVAVVLHRSVDLQVSVSNDADNLYVQALVLADGDDRLGETDDGRAIGDRSELRLDVDADQKHTPDVDRTYFLNPWPARQGLYYNVVLGSRHATKLLHDSEGRGSIRYVELPDGRRIRVDSYVIPLYELGREPGQPMRLAYWTKSPAPELIFNSVGFETPGDYLSNAMPYGLYHAIELQDRAAIIDPGSVPSGREDNPVEPKPALKPMPQIGDVPPEVTAADWINVESPPTLEGLRGDLVLIAFWSPSCGACVTMLRDLNDLNDRHGDVGLTILSFTKNSRQGIEWFKSKKVWMGFPVGTGSSLRIEYGVESDPHVFLIGRDGRLLWQGKPDMPQLEDRIIAALE